MVILHLILHSAVHIHDFHIFITSEQLLIHLTERWREAVERISFLWEYCLLISLKLLTVSNNILLQRLNDLGIRGDIWLWLKNFLTERGQFVRINGCDSYTHIITHGVPEPPYSRSLQTTSQNHYALRKPFCSRKTTQQYIVSQKRWIC